MDKSKTRPHAIRCGAKTRSGEPCNSYAMANGKCRMHGGKSTGPKDRVKKSEDMEANKNAVTTGENESIWHDTLTDEEKGLLKLIDLDKLKQLDNEIRLIDIRLRRMMGRIAKLQEVNGTTIEIVVKTGPMGEETITKTQDTLSQVQNIEEAITRVQAQKLRLLKAKHEIEISSEDAELADDGFIAAMTGQVDEVWDDYEDY